MQPGSWSHARGPYLKPKAAMVASQLTFWCLRGSLSNSFSSSWLERSLQNGCESPPAPPPPPPGIFQLPVALCLKMRRSTYPDPANIFLLPLCAPASEPLLSSGKKLTWAFPSSYLVNSVLLVPRIWHFLTSLMRWNPLLQATKCKELLCLLRVLIE